MGKYRPSEDSDLSESDLDRFLQLRQKKSKSTKKKDVKTVRTTLKKKSSIPPVRKPNTNRSMSTKSLRSSEPFQVCESDSSYEKDTVKKSKVQNPRENGAERTQNRVSDIKQNESYRGKSPAKRAVKTIANTGSDVKKHEGSESGYAEEQNSSDRSTDEKLGRVGYEDANENTSEHSHSVFEKEGDAVLATVAEPTEAKNVSESLPTENQVQERRAKQNDLEVGARGESSGSRSIFSADADPPDIRESVEGSQQQTSPLVAARVPPEIILVDASVNTDVDLSAEQVGKLPANPPDDPRYNQGDASVRNTLGYWLNMLKNEGPDAKGITSEALDLRAKDVAIRREQANVDLIQEKVWYVRQKRLRLSRRNT